MSNPLDNLYVSDLDGTLLSPDSNFSKDATDRLNRLIDKGLKFSIATARNYDSVYPILYQLKLKLPVILFNGVYLTDFQSGENLEFTEPLCPDIVSDLMALAETLESDPFVYTHKHRNRLFYRNLTNRGSSSFVEYLNGLGSGNRLKYISDFKFLELENISGMLFIDTFSALEPLHSALSKKHHDKVNMYFARDISKPEFYWLQIFHAKANKGSMLKNLANRVGVPLGKTVVFGDYLNDLDMFNVAGWSIAVANALPEVRAAADEIIGANCDLAVIEYLENQILT